MCLCVWRKEREKRKKERERKKKDRGKEREREKDGMKLKRTKKSFEEENPRAIDDKTTTFVVVFFLISMWYIRVVLSLPLLNVVELYREYKRISSPCFTTLNRAAGGQRERKKERKRERKKERKKEERKRNEGREKHAMAPICCEELGREVSSLNFAAAISFLCLLLTRKLKKL